MIVFHITRWLDTDLNIIHEYKRIDISKLKLDSLIMPQQFLWMVKIKLKVQGGLNGTYKKEFRFRELPAETLRNLYNHYLKLKIYPGLRIVLAPLIQIKKLMEWKQDIPNELISRANRIINSYSNSIEYKETRINKDIKFIRNDYIQDKYTTFSGDIRDLLD